MTNVVKFPGFNANPGPLAIPAQMMERVQEAKSAGREVHIVAVVIEKSVNGFWSYHPYWDTQPREIMLFAAGELEHYARLVEENDPDPRPVA